MAALGFVRSSWSSSTGSTRIKQLERAAATARATPSTSPFLVAPHDCVAQGITRVDDAGSALPRSR
jgi:hypothetical protein